MARILLLESDRILGATTASFFKTQVHQVDHAVEPQQAIAMADANQPDAVVIDLLLAGRSGVEFMYEFRSYPDWKHLPVVVYSDLPVIDLAQCSESLAHLNIYAFCRKSFIGLAELSARLDQAMQLATVK